MQKEFTFARKLLAWYKKNACRFPWRETKDPYKILLAEILLRKTTRNQVKEIFEKLLERYPTLEKLAFAEVKELEGFIKPLGMQKKRARLLKKLAKCIVENYGGSVPEDRHELLKLPGVGVYSANAVLCLAYGKQVPLVDTNVIRVVERVFQIKSEKARARTDPMVWSFVEKLIPKGRAREFNLALLDFANLVCTSRLPRCSICPLREICLHSTKTKSQSQSSAEKMQFSSDEQ